MKLHKGFSLVELLIVLIIIGILAAIAYPSYKRYVIQANRNDMQSEMMRIAQSLQGYRVINHSYQNATLAAVDASANYPATKTLYTLVLTDAAAAPKALTDASANAQTWVLTATPTGLQKDDGHIVINHRGERCWAKGSDKNSGTACVPSSTSNWDGK